MPYATYHVFAGKKLTCYYEIILFELLIASHQTLNYFRFPVFEPTSHTLGPSRY
jgi:hypothetical protein